MYEEDRRYYDLLYRFVKRVSEVGGDRG